MFNHLVGKMVRFVVNGETAFSGLCRYVTKDGWCGIRTEGDRMDEAPALLCEVIEF